MTDLLYEVDERIAYITLNRVDKSNAFDSQLLLDIGENLNKAIIDSAVRVIVLKANGKHFSAGADIHWMQKMANYTEEENKQDALILGNVMYQLNQSPKPTIAMIQGAAFGGGAGLVAACDIAIAAETARFCFSEVTLGLIPAVISPYVVQAMGERTAAMLFMSAEVFNAQKAKDLQLIHHCLPDDELWSFTKDYAKKISTNAPDAVMLSKKLAHEVGNRVINKDLVTYTASLIAQKRVSSEGQKGLKAFLHKELPNWD